jgi:hypothetical protein
MPSFMIRGRGQLLACSAALVLVLVSTASCNTEPAFRPYDLVVNERNLNLTPLNPQWYSHVHDNRLPSPDLCQGAKPWDIPCTSQVTWANLSESYKGPWCNHDGHHNWTWATYEGTPEWEGHSASYADDDYNIKLRRADNAGVTASDRDHILMEFDSENTVDHFDTPGDDWWYRFHNAVDHSDGNINDLAHRMLRETEVIALGLLGLDGGHPSNGAELHPVIAMAVHINRDPNDDTWAFFAMGWGDEGGCASKIELFPTQLPISFLLRRPGATAVTILRQDIRCICLPESHWGLDLKTNQGAELWFTLPDTELRSGRPYGDRYHGEIHLKWTVDPTKVGPASPPALPPSVEQDEEANKFETVISRLVANMTPAQRAMFDKLAPAPPPVSPDQALQSMSTSLEGPKMPATTPALDKPNQLVDSEWQQRQQQVIAAIRAAYGGSLPSPFDK